MSHCLNTSVYTHTLLIVQTFQQLFITLPYQTEESNLLIPPPSHTLIKPKVACIAMITLSGGSAVAFLMMTSGGATWLRHHETN